MEAEAPSGVSSSEDIYNSSIYKASFEQIMLRQNYKKNKCGTTQIIAKNKLVKQHKFKIIKRSI